MNEVFIKTGDRCARIFEYGGKLHAAILIDNCLYWETRALGSENELRETVKEVFARRLRPTINMVLPWNEARLLISKQLAAPLLPHPYFEFPSSQALPRAWRYIPKHSMYVVCTPTRNAYVQYHVAHNVFAAVVLDLHRGLCVKSFRNMKDGASAHALALSWCSTDLPDGENLSVHTDTWNMDFATMSGIFCDVAQPILLMKKLHGFEHISMEEVTMPKYAQQTSSPAGWTVVADNLAYYRAPDTMALVDGAALLLLMLKNTTLVHVQVRRPEKVTPQNLRDYCECAGLNTDWIGLNTDWIDSHRYTVDSTVANRLMQMTDHDASAMLRLLLTVAPRSQLDALQKLENGMAALRTQLHEANMTIAAQAKQLLKK